MQKGKVNETKIINTNRSVCRATHHKLLKENGQFRKPVHAGLYHRV